MKKSLNPSAIAAADQIAKGLRRNDPHEIRIARIFITHRVAVMTGRQLLRLFNVLRRATEAQSAALATQKKHEIGVAIEEAAEKLPNGWKILIDIECDSGGVDLESPEGARIDYPSNHEWMCEEIRDALECAIDCESSNTAAC